MRILFFVLLVCFLIIGCGTLKQVAHDYETGLSDTDIVNTAGVNSQRFGDIAGMVASASGCPVPISDVIDKVFTVLSCYLFLWHGGYQRRKLFSDTQKVG